MNARLTNLLSQKALFSHYADQARFAGAFDVEADWMVDVAEVQALIEAEYAAEAAEEARIAREQRIADIASGRYRNAAR